MTRDRIETEDTTRIAEPVSGLDLLSVRRFRPFFLTQFLGAFNDNVYRNALIGLVAFQIAGLDSATLGAGSLINMAAGLFILPFFLCSAIAGQLADKFDKAVLIRRIKLAEIVIMSVGAFAVILASLPLLMLSVLMMGTQSAFFGPVKYGILPMHLHSDELTGGNALVQSGTMVAILLGTIAGGLLVNVPGQGRAIVAVAVVVLAVLGWITSRGIPAARSESRHVAVDLNIFRSTWQILRSVAESRTLVLAVLGISWFWFLGSILLAQLPVFVRDDLGGGQPVATLLLCTFTIGVVAGTFLCEKFSGRRVEIGLVPMGALGVTVFAAMFATIDLPAEAAMTVSSMYSTSTGIAIVASLFLLSVSTGLYIVPLYALIQTRADRAFVSRVIAFNNVVNALLMVLASVVAILMLQAGLTIQQMILAVTVMHVAVVVFIFLEIPEFAMRLFVWLITHSLYRVQAQGIDNIPERGPAVLVSNHVSLIDALIITAKCRRIVRFVMYYKIYELPFLNYLFRAGGAIPIASQRENPELLERAFEKIAATLERGGLIGIFPEGRLTEDGETGPFRPGIERVLERTPVPVVPMALSGLWGTFFTRQNGRLMSRWPHHWLARVVLNVGEPVAARDADRESLETRVRALMNQRPA